MNKTNDGYMFDIDKRMWDLIPPKERENIINEMSVRLVKELMREGKLEIQESEFETPLESGGTFRALRYIFKLKTKLKRFLVFYCGSRYPRIGMDAFLTSCESMSEVEKLPEYREVIKLRYPNDDMWLEVYDQETNTRKYINEGELIEDKDFSRKA